MVNGNLIKLLGTKNSIYYLSDFKKEYHSEVVLNDKILQVLLKNFNKIFRRNRDVLNIEYLSYSSVYTNIKKFRINEYLRLREDLIENEVLSFIETDSFLPQTFLDTYYFFLRRIKGKLAKNIRDLYSFETSYRNKLIFKLNSENDDTFVKNISVVEPDRIFSMIYDKKNVSFLSTKIGIFKKKNNPFEDSLFIDSYIFENKDKKENYIYLVKFMHQFYRI